MLKSKNRQLGFAAMAYFMLRSRHTKRGQTILWIALAARLGLSGIALLLSMLEKTQGRALPEVREAATGD